MAVIEVGVKVICDENGPLYIFVGETEGLCYFQVEWWVIWGFQCQKTFRNHNNLNCDRIFRAKH